MSNQIRIRLRLSSVFTLDNIYLDLQYMVLDRGGLPPQASIHNAPCSVHHEHPVLCRIFMEPLLDIVEVTCTTKEGLKQVHTIS